MRILTRHTPKGWLYTIRVKVAAAISILLGLISLFILVLFPAKLEEQAFRAISAKAISIADMTAFSITPALFFEDEEGMEEVLRSARQNEDLAYILVFNDSGKLVADFNKDRAKHLICSLERIGNHISEDGSTYKVSTPILLRPSNHRIGQIQMGLSLKSLRSDVSSSRKTIASFIFVIFSIGVIFVFAISAAATGHLGKMAETFEQISKGDLTKRADISSRDEVGHLARSFNLMVDNLEAARNALEGLNRSLEERVEVRTKELQEEFDEHKITGKALRESEGQLRAILESTDDGILVVDSMRRIILSNKNFSEMWHIPDKLIAESDCEQLINYVMDQLEDPDDFISMTRTLYESSKASFDTLYFRDGRVFERSSSPLIVEDRLAGRVWSFSDVTDRKKAEQEKSRLEIRLQRAEKMEALGTLAGGVAHDLNNILSGVVSYPDLLLMSIPENSDLRDPILTIKKSGQKAAAVVQDLLTLARRGVNVTDVCNLNEIVLDYFQSPVQAGITAHHSHIQFSTNLELGLLDILGSPLHLSKTIMNLISNAAEAMPDGGEVATSTRNQYIDTPIRGYDTVEEGDYVVLEVSDNGIGIPKEDLNRIFEPFYTKKAMGRSGTGLGMAVVWGTVKDHHGYINVESTEGKGTTFELYFPVTRQKSVQNTSPLSINELMGNGETILVMDDIQEQRELAKGMLERLGYKVTTAASGETAVEHMKNDQADLVMLDMIMDPGIDGLETYRRILEFHPDQKAIIVSGFSETDRVREAQMLGAVQYVRKPYILDTLGIAVKIELNRSNYAETVG